ncbi:MAG: glycosyltransferase family 4 protein [Bacteroidetes bacterium]|nr:glycosyltransferase family 4 protein [Bacteroidota bacterium]
MSLKQTIIITAPYLINGGVSAFVGNITPFFRSNIKVFHRGSKSPVESSIVKARSFILLPYRFLFSVWKHKPQCIIVNTSLSINCLIRDGLIVYLSKLFRIKVLLIIHGFEEDSLKQIRLLKLGYFRSDAIIVLADIFRDLLVNVGYKQKIYVQHNPVHHDVFEYINANQSCYNNSSFKNFMFFSRIEIDKGIFIALDAFHLLVSEYPDINLTVIGDGQALNKAKKYVEDKLIPSITFTGFVTGREKLQLLSRCDTLLFPTSKEGLPISVLEAMAAGQIIVTRPVGGLVDLFKICKFGFCISSKDPKDFSYAMREIIEQNEKFKKVRLNNAEFSKQYFHSKIIAQRIEGIIADMNGEC